MSGVRITPNPDRRPAFDYRFSLLAALLAACLVLHYPQQFLGVASPSLFSSLGLTRHAVERILLLVPVAYGAVAFGVPGGTICLVISLLIMIPRVVLLSQYVPDAVVETAGVTVVGVLVTWWVGAFRREKEKRLLALRDVQKARDELEERSAALEGSERKYRDLLQNAADAIWEQNLDGILTNTNRAGEVLCGYSRQELLGMDVRSFLAEDSLNWASQIRKALFSGEEIVRSYEQRLIRRNGSVAIVQMSTSLVVENDKPIGFLHIARDVTAGRQLENVLATMDQGIAMIGLDHRIQFMNPSLVREFGEGEGSECFAHFYRRSAPCDVCRLGEVAYGKSVQRESSFGDGNTFSIDYVPFTGLDLAPCALATFSNVTKRKKLEAELVKVNEVHSRLLTEKVEQLKLVSLEVARLEQQKAEFIRFLGVVAHDLKSPLAVSKSILGGITGGYYGGLTHDQNDMLERVIRRIDGLNYLIDDLIDVPLLETGQLAREMVETSIADVARAVADELERMAAEKGLQLAVALPPDVPMVQASSRRLHQVMTNLLGNAIKYTEKGGVWVRLSAEEGLVRVEVSDSGIGVSEDDLPRLFTDFFRGKNAGANRGTGLGLSICRRIVEAHGGRIWAESPNPEIGNGSRFIFELPAKKAVSDEE